MASAFPTLTSSSVNPLRNRCINTSFASLNREISTSGVQITEGVGKLPKLVLLFMVGIEAEIYLFGGCITSWKVANGKDLLFVRPDAVFNGQKPISGGIPHCFPQFGPGPMQQHGFARNMNWSISDTENVEGNPIITLELKDSPYSRSMWDFGFQAMYKVTLNSKSLSTKFIITNTDKKPFSFSSALHTYFRVRIISSSPTNKIIFCYSCYCFKFEMQYLLADLNGALIILQASVTGASVKGLKGCKTLNKDPDPSNPLEGKEKREVIAFPGFVDCVYLDTPNELHLDNGLGDKISIKNTNWTDAVLWNLHLQMESCYQDFVCVENAKIGKVHLEPEQSWVAEQQLSFG
ncbi:putative glucose-6-phosphate 1-epimerase isoform X1 [Magnolia sinica]|uniref:putative glucose-6-phosphate 1-epimerase isoform X1 n=1 Tax=Magnolia sinica TaxID=86752 RepID=UPI00265A65DE|nr:putative glucose-6-phosphate 1-epimerase isoform X1 [Magnolia sinica]